MRLNRDLAADYAMKEIEIRKRFELLKPTLNERTRRLWAAAEAKAAGPGSISMVAKATGISRPTILQGIKELDEPSQRLDPRKIRNPGAGAPTLVAKNPAVKEALERLIAPDTRGIPNRHCGGPAKVSETLQMPCARWAIRSVLSRWLTCFIR